MSFSSLVFFLLLPFAFLGFLLTPGRFRRIILLISSIGFYTLQGEPILLVVLVWIIVISYLIGLLLGKQESTINKNLLLTFGIILLLIPLFLLRYLPVLLAQLKPVYISFGSQNFLPALGVSFYTFQAISYLIDIYLGTGVPEINIGIYSLYISFFPKIIQGPIERGRDLLPQLKQDFHPRYSMVMNGLSQIVLGLICKLILADRIGIFVDSVYNNVYLFSGWPLITATYLYAFQIYFDFYGYSQIALGIAKLFNIKLTDNFNKPYLAVSIPDFWRRWHITFSRWILDYLFKPLQFGLRQWGRLGSAAALIITFLVSGFWHGASWGFIAWGGIHGIYMAVSVFTGPIEKKWLKKHHLNNSVLMKGIQIFITFQLVCFSWIFFRANSFGDSVYIISHLFSGLFTIDSSGFKTFLNENLLFGQNNLNAFIVYGLLSAFLAFSIFQSRIPISFGQKFLDYLWAKRRNFSIQIVVMGVVVLVFGIVALSSRSSSFIYSVF